MDPRTDARIREERSEKGESVSPPNDNANPSISNTLTDGGRPSSVVRHAPPGDEKDVNSTGLRASGSCKQFHSFLDLGSIRHFVTVSPHSTEAERRKGSLSNL